MHFGPWAVLLVAGIASGAVTCAALVVPRRLLWAAGLTGTVSAVVLSGALTGIWQSTHRPDALIAAVFISAGASVGGFALASSSVATVTRVDSEAPALLSTPTADGRVSVVVLADEEPEEYAPSATTAVFDRYERSDVPLPPDVARPLVYASQRASYRRIGGSPARATVRSTAESLAVRLRDEGVAGTVKVAFCSGGPSLADVVASEVADGASSVIVAALTVEWSGPFDGAVGRTALLGLGTAGVDLEVTAPMWASEHVSAMLAQRALSALGGDRTSDGVVIISAGEPEQLERDHPAAVEQTTFFSQRVRADLIEAGLAPERIRRAWLEWEEPDVSEAVRHLAAVGARRIVLVPADFPADTIATLIDLRFAAERAADETGTSVSVLPAWGDDPAVVETLRDGVVESLARLGRA